MKNYILTKFLSLLTLTLLFCTIAFGYGCESKKKDNTSTIIGGLFALMNKTTTAAKTTETGAGTTTGNSNFTAGSVVSQSVELTAGTEFTSEYNATTASSSILSRATSSSTILLEVSIVDESGIEVFYARSDATGKLTIKFTPTGTGKKTYKIVIKNNSKVAIALNRDETKTTGGTFTGTVDNSNLTAKYKDYTLKAFVSFSQSCYANNSSSFSTAGKYRPFAFVSLGKVDATTKKVTDISSSTITLKMGDKSIQLIKISDSSYFSGSMTAEQKAAYKNFYKLLYAGYYGLVGELYMTPSDCSSIPEFNLGTDPGANVVTLSVSDTTISPSLSQDFKFKPTVLAPAEMYENDGTTRISSNGIYGSTSCNYFDDTLDTNNFGVSTSKIGSYNSGIYGASTIPVPSVSVTNSAAASTTTAPTATTTTTTATTTTTTTYTTVDLPATPVLKTITASLSGSIVTVTVDASNITAGGNISASLAPLDTLNSSGYYYGGSNSISLSYNTTLAKYVGTYTIPSYMKSGDWIISNLSLNNSVSTGTTAGTYGYAYVTAYYSYNKITSTTNYSLYTTSYGSNRAYTSSSSSDSGIAFAKFTVSGTTEDITAPTLTSISLDKSSVSLSSTVPSATVTITVKATDIGSGISSISGNLGLKNNSSSYSGYFYLSKQTDGSYVGSTTLYANNGLSSATPTGTYQVNSLTITDIAGNTAYYTALNGCRTLDAAAPPKLKVTQPSTLSGATVTTASNPTRAFFFGYSQPKAFWAMWKQLGETIQSGSVTSAEIDGCFYNGGIIGVPISSTGLTDIPVGDFNAASGDIINLSSSTGSSSSFSDFYQGNVDVSGSVTIPALTVSNAGSTGVSKNYTLTLKNCTMKADSAMAVFGIGLYTYSSSYYNSLSGKIK